MDRRCNGCCCSIGSGKMDVVRLNIVGFALSVITLAGCSKHMEQRNCIHDGGQKSFLLFSGEGIQDVLLEKFQAEYLTVSDEAYDGLETVY